MLNRSFNIFVSSKFTRIENSLEKLTGDKDVEGSIEQKIASLQIDDYLKKDDASKTYQTKDSLNNDVKTIEFIYTEEIKTLQGIIDDLKARIEALENQNTEE